MYAFPPWSLILLVLQKLHSSSGVLMTLVATFLVSACVVSLPSGSGSGRSGTVAVVFRSSQTAHFHCRHLGISRLSLPAWRLSSSLPGLKVSLPRVATQIGFVRRSPSCSNYQVKWSVYRQWCRAQGHSVSRPTLPNVADFLFWLHRSRKLSVSSILGYRSMISSVFRFKIPEISSPPVITDLIRPFKVKAPARPVHPPAWDLDVVLRYLISFTFEPLSSTPLRSLAKKVLFLVFLATAKRVGELQVVSRYVSFASSGSFLAYVPEFLAKTKSVFHPLPRSFLVKFLSDFAADLDQVLLLCLSEPYASISGGHLPWSIVLVVYSFLLVLSLVRCLRTVSCIFLER